MAMFAVKRLATFATHAHLGIAPAVHKHYGLVTVGKALDKRVAQVGRHQDSLLLADLAHVDDLHIRKCRRSCALLQFQVL